jgi:formate hydrogenlyase subunit 6/NADH:ubiquinone oxidoreductase subunit I
VSDVATQFVVGPAGLAAIVDELGGAGYQVWGPVVRDGVITTRRLSGSDPLPVGWVADQAPGSSRLVDSGDRSRFGWAVGPQPWKPLLHPASVVTMHLTQTGRDQPVSVSVPGRPAQPFALFGLRPCDLAAIDTLDHALLDAPPTAEPIYRARRDDAFLVVVNCGVPAATCGCVAFDTGPHVGARRSHDLEITELVDAARPDTDPEYVVVAINERGGTILERVVARLATVEVEERHRTAIEAQRELASTAIERYMPTDRIRGALAAARDLDRWTEVADRCVACGNCTAVCPTCFCTTIDDVGDLTGAHVERRREWESCFSLEFSRLGGHSVRSSVDARYRQWMTHKLGTWHDQFGESGCVGCGRCTTWCPVGIDFVDVAQGLVDDMEAR